MATMPLCDLVFTSICAGESVIVSKYIALVPEILCFCFCLEQLFSSSFLDCSNAGVSRESWVLSLVSAQPPLLIISTNDPGFKRTQKTCNHLKTCVSGRLKKEYYKTTSFKEQIMKMKQLERNIEETDEQAGDSVITRFNKVTSSSTELYRLSTSTLFLLTIDCPLVQSQGG
jgi:hypothetical protein